MKKQTKALTALLASIDNPPYFSFHEYHNNCHSEFLSKLVLAIFH